MKRVFTIISDTASSTINDEKVAYEPVVKEVQYFSSLFDEIYWLTYDYPSNHTIYSAEIPENVSLIPVKNIGGKNLISKFQIFFQYPKLLRVVKDLLKKSDYVHVRAPSHPAIICMLINIYYKKKVWYKYAGSWVDEAPFSYNLQRKILYTIADKNNIITINGDWKIRNNFILPFENPSFSENDRKYYSSRNNNKSFNGALNLVYVGSLSEFKGIHLVIKALNKYKTKKIRKFQIIGTGDYEQELKKMVVEGGENINVEFKGRLSKKDTFDCLTQSHFLIIASKTEGFPKVISEAMMNGCIPISTNVSCIDQYINDKNGFIIQERSVNGIVDVFRDIEIKNNTELEEMSKRCIKKASIFTYEYYLDRIENNIFDL